MHQHILCVLLGSDTKGKNNMVQKSKESSLVWWKIKIQFLFLCNWGYFVGMEKVLIKNGSAPLPCLLFFLTHHPSPHRDQVSLDFSRKLFINGRFGMAVGGGELVRPPPTMQWLWAYTCRVWGSQGGDAKNARLKTPVGLSYYPPPSQYMTGWGAWEVFNHDK